MWCVVVSCDAMWCGGMRGAAILFFVVCCAVVRCEVLWRSVSRHRLHATHHDVNRAHVLSWGAFVICFVVELVVAALWRQSLCRRCVHAAAAALRRPLARTPPRPDVDPERRPLTRPLARPPRLLRTDPQATRGADSCADTPDLARSPCVRARARQSGALGERCRCCARRRTRTTTAPRTRSPTCTRTPGCLARGRWLGRPGPVFAEVQLMLLMQRCSHRPRLV